MLLKEEKSMINQILILIKNKFGNFRKNLYICKSFNTYLKEKIYSMKNIGRNIIKVDERNDKAFGTSILGSCSDWKFW